MATNNNLEIALRVKADLDAARQQVDGLTGDIERLSQRSTESGQAVREAGAGVDSSRAQMTDAASAANTMERSLEQAGRSAQQTGNSTQMLGGSVVQVMADIRAFEEANTGAAMSMDQIAEQEQRLDRLFSQGLLSVNEYQEALENLDKAEASLTRETQRATRESERQDRALQRVLGTADKTEAELRKLDDAKRVLEQAFRDGRISIDQYNSALEGIDKRRAHVERMADSTQRLGANSRTARSQIITLTRSLSTGNFDRVAFDLARLGNSTSTTGAGFSRMAIGVGVVTAGLGLFTAAAYSAWRQNRELENALILTNNAAGLTSSSFQQISREIEQTSQATIGQAQDITMALARTGQFGSNVIAEYGRAVSALQRVTGRSADELAQELARMRGNISEWAAEQNEVWRFLTAQQYENIRAMEERGDVEGAQLAVSQALNERYADSVDESVGRIEGAWIRARTAASNYWQIVRDLAGAEDSDQSLLDRREFQMRQLLRSFERSGRDPDQDPRVVRMRQEIFDLRSLIQEAEAEAQQQAEEQAENDAAIAARRRIRVLQLRGDTARQMQQELDQLTRDFEAARAAEGETPVEFSAEAEAILRQRIVERYTESTKDAVSQSERYVTQLERQAEQVSLTTEELEIQRIVEMNLTEEQQRRVELAQELIDAEERRQAQARDAQQLMQVQIELLRAQGHEAQALTLQFEQQYGELLERLRARGDEDGVSLIDQLLNMQQLQTRLTEVESEITRVLNEQQRREASIAAQREAGLITEANARRQIVELHRETYDALQAQTPLLEELARQPGEVGESAGRALQTLNQQSQELLNTVSLLESVLRGSLEQGIADALTGLAKGTLTLREAVNSLANTVADAIIRMQAEQIAQSVTGSLFGGGGEPGAEDAAAGAAQAQAITAAGATAATSMSTGITAGAQAGATSMGSSITAAGAGAASQISASMTAAGAAAAAQISAAMMTGAAVGGVAGGVAAATGGHIRGPGTGTSDSIPAMLSDYEYVTRAAVVRQAGALDFLHDFNQRGMDALADWAPALHNTGGLAGMPAPNMPSPRINITPDFDRGAQGTTELTMRQVNVVDPELVADYLDSPEGDKVQINMLRRNTTLVTRILGLRR